MTWFAFKGYYNNQAIDLAGVQEKIAAGFGFHGYSTAKEAEDYPNSVNFLQGVEVEGLIVDYEAALKGQEQPGGANASNLISGGEQADTSIAQSAASNSVSGLINFIGQKNIWTRGAEFLIGAMLIYIGVKALATPSGQQPAKQTIKSTAKNIAKAVK
jgi:hypothetical protein